MRILQAAVATVTVLLAGVVSLSPATAACIPSGSPSTLQQRAADADAVFVGTVTRVDGPDTTAQVTDVYKGTVPPRVVVDTAGTSTTFAPNTQYLFVATGSGGRLATTACFGSAEVNDAVIGAAENVLGMPTSYRNPAATVSSAPTTAPTAATPTPSIGAAPASSSRNTTAYVVTGLILVLAIGAAFVLPSLRRRRRVDDPPEGSDDI